MVDQRSVSQSPRESPVARGSQEMPPPECNYFLTIHCPTYISIIDATVDQPPPEKEVEKKGPTEVELESNVSLMLEETPTIWLLEIPGIVIEKVQKGV